MTIAFICGSLEPGKDGVGDYTRRLAAEIVRQGHQSFIIAINDKFTNQTLFEHQDDQDTQLRVLRLSKQTSWKKRIKEAKNLIHNVNPNWISLQFVPFSFQKRGLPFGLASRLQKIGPGRKWHIMFHELWVGVSPNIRPSLNNYILAILQKALVLRGIKKLKPAAITASVPDYLSQLNSFNPRWLHLFGNIPIENLDSPTPLATETIKSIHFGTYSSRLRDFEEQINWIKAITEKVNARMLFISLGNGGPFKEDSLAIAKKLIGNDNVIDLGMLPASKVSNVLNNAHIGISRADAYLWRKSGTTMAMIEHGLPIVLKGKRSDLSFNYSEKYLHQLYFPSDIIDFIPKKSNKLNLLKESAKNMMDILMEN